MGGWVSGWVGGRPGGFLPFVKKCRFCAVITLLSYSAIIIHGMMFGVIKKHGDKTFLISFPSLFVLFTHTLHSPHLGHYHKVHATEV